MGELQDFDVPEDEMDLAEEIQDMYNDPEFDDLSYSEFLSLIDEVADELGTDPD